MNSNKLRGTITPLVVKAPGFGDRRKAILQDIAILTGGTVISEEVGRKLDSVGLADLGGARRVHSDKDTTIIVEGRGDKEDALHATRAAVEEGMVTGGGVAYMNLASALDTVPTRFDEERMALNILRRALEEPTRQIAQNAGAHGAIVVEAIRRRQRESANPMIGFDAMRGEYGDLAQWGIIDPAKVVRAALENVVSVAGMILSTDTLIAEIPEPKKNGAAAVPDLEY